VIVELAHYELETLHEDGEFILHRGRRRTSAETSPLSILALSPAVEHPAIATIKKIEQEFSFRDDLSPAWALRPIALKQQQNRPMLLFDDPEAEPLERLVRRPMEFGPFLCCAVALAVTLRQMHKQGLIHKEIKPSNVLASAALDRVWLRGFGIASRLPRERQHVEPPELIAGTLAYMAPEQTGRMNRSIDSRCDLYALGVTLYELLTGSLPFTASDPMEWIHCHIARQPLTPTKRRSDVPRPVSAVVMKLLAKAPEERYQTAAGVERDLRRCLDDWNRTVRIRGFTPGENDIPDRLVVPEKLYGREREVETLLASFDRVVTSGIPELVLVCGYSGIGKSSVVNELQPVLVPPRGLFASGKFDQYKRDIPYATLAQAFRGLVRPLLMKSETALGLWRREMRDALGQNGQLIVDLVPELKLVIGDQPPVPEVPVRDAQRRFQLVIRRFISVFARPEHPLVLFLDDLQWLDAATLDLLEDLLTRSELPHLMLIGAYRDNEVDAAHPLMRKLEAIKSAGGRVHGITLAPLAETHVAQLLADALRLEPERSAPLAHMVLEKTGGNPFFTVQFISSLEKKKLLTFDQDAGWSWDLERIRATEYTDNVVDLMIMMLRGLPAQTQTALQQLACLGNVAEVTTLATVLEMSQEQVDAALWESLRQGLLERRHGSYKFAHDRVQEAAYALMPEASRGEAHARIGRLLFANTPPAEREAAIFDIVTQLNRGAGLISSREEREQLAELNVVAGQRAKASAAYASALTYFVAGATLLLEDSWQHRHDLTFALELHRAECEYLTGQLNQAEERLRVLAAHATTLVERAAVTGLRLNIYLLVGQFDRALADGFDCLREMGVECSSHPNDEEVRREYELIWSHFGTRAIEDLIELPVSSDPAFLATLSILVLLARPANLLDPNLHALITCRAVALSVEHGNCDASCNAYAWLGALACARFGDYQRGYRIGRVGCQLLDRRGWMRFQPNSLLTFGANIIPWVRPLKDGRDWLHRAFEVATNIGDVIHSRGTNLLIANMLAAGDRLADVEFEARRALDIALKAHHLLSVEMIRAQLGLVRTLRGLNGAFGCLDSEHFDESVAERGFASDPGRHLVECFYWICKLQARFFAGDHAAAIDCSSHAKRLLGAMASTLFVAAAEYHLYSALSRAVCCDSASREERQQHVESVATHQRQLDIWAQNCPENFENCAALVGAEFARLKGRELDAMRLYETAIHSSRASGFVHYEGLAYERASAFYRARGFDQIADIYLRTARVCYASWGADGKVTQLDRLYPGLQQDQPLPGPTATFTAPVEGLDLATMIRVSQAISSEIVLDKLLDTVMRTAMEHAGAERGLLILPRGDALQVVAEATTSADAVVVRPADTRVSAELLPESIARYVARTQETVLLADASAENLFWTDLYIQVHGARSILCLPLIHQGRLIGILYLENNLATHVFTSARLAVLTVLASQAATSLENTRLYADVKESEAKIHHVSRIATVSALTASIAHEVNQPLAGIITNADTCLLMLDANPPDIDGARATAKRTLRDANRASDVIARLRALFSKKDLTLESLDLNQVAREVVTLSASELQRHRVILESEFTDDLPLIIGDRVQLQQVILNLLRNASDAMSGVEGRPRQLLVKTAREIGNRVRLTVRDTGVGFGLEGADRLFDAFYTTKSGGMGIGLSVSRSIIERHHGRLWAESNDGPGATFSFAIPYESVTSAVAPRTDTKV
jgi:predicted ATPase/signal transduction histidine kinase